MFLCMSYSLSVSMSPLDFSVFCLLFWHRGPCLPVYPECLLLSSRREVAVWSICVCLSIWPFVYVYICQFLHQWGAGVRETETFRRNIHSTVFLTICVRFSMYLSASGVLYNTHIFIIYIYIYIYII